MPSGWGTMLTTVAGWFRPNTRKETAVTSMQDWSQPGRTPQGIAPPPSVPVRVPDFIPDSVRAPGLPPCWLTVSTEGADIKTSFDPSEVIQALMWNLGKQLRKKFDLNVGPAQAGTPAISVQLVRMDEGSRVLRYLLGIFAGGTTLAIDGHFLDRAGQWVPFSLKQRGLAGFFGGSGIGLLKTSTVALASKIRKMVFKAWK